MLVVVRGVVKKCSFGNGGQIVRVVESLDFPPRSTSLGVEPCECNTGTPPLSGIEIVLVVVRGVAKKCPFGSGGQNESAVASLEWPVAVLA